MNLDFLLMIPLLWVEQDMTTLLFISLIWRMCVSDTTAFHIKSIMLTLYFVLWPSSKQSVKALSLKKRIQSRTSSSEECGSSRIRWTPACGRSDVAWWEPLWRAAAPDTCCRSAVMRRRKQLRVNVSVQVLFKYFKRGVIYLVLKHT